MFKNLIESFLPGLQKAIVGKLLGDLEGAAKKIAIGEAAKLTARGLVKGIDGFAAVTVKHLSPTDSLTLTAAYVAELQNQIQQLADAAALYAPLALDVERNKKQFGTTSAEANAARVRRAAGITEMRQEVRDVLFAAIGGKTAD